MSETIYKVNIEEEHQGTRIDLVLSVALPETSRSFIQKLITGGSVSIDGQVCKSKKQKVESGQEITIVVPEPEILQVEAEDIPLEIIYEDDDVLVVNKPKGMVVHPAVGNYNGTLVNAVMYHCGDSLSSINGVIRPGIVHRIDKDTSGLLAVAKNDLAHVVLASQLKDHTMARTYECIVCGNLKEDSGTVNAPIGRHPSDRKKMCVIERNSKEAVTHWEVVKRYRGYTHVRCRLETGRTHQIRVHMAHIGHPILGDVVYGRKKPELGQSSQCLHAGQLCFQHPRDGRPVMVFAPRPDYFEQVLQKLQPL